MRRPGCWYRGRSFEGVHDVEQRVAVVEVYPGHDPAPWRRFQPKPIAPARDPLVEILPQRSLHHFAEGHSVVRRALPGAAHDLFVQIHRRPHASKHTIRVIFMLDVEARRPRAIGLCLLSRTPAGAEATPR